MTNKDTPSSNNTHSEHDLHMREFYLSILGRSSISLDFEQRKMLQAFLPPHTLASSDFESVLHIATARSQTEEQYPQEYFTALAESVSKVIEEVQKNTGLLFCIRKEGGIFYGKLPDKIRIYANEDSYKKGEARITSMRVDIAESILKEHLVPIPFIERLYPFFPELSRAYSGLAISSSQKTRSAYKRLHRNFLDYRYIDLD